MLTICCSDGSSLPSFCGCQWPESWMTDVGSSKSLELIVSVPFKTWPTDPPGLAMNCTVMFCSPPGAMLNAPAGAPTSCQPLETASELTVSVDEPVLRSFRIDLSWKMLFGTPLVVKSWIYLQTR